MTTTDLEPLLTAARGNEAGMAELLRALQGAEGWLPARHEMKKEEERLPADGTIGLPQWRMGDQEFVPVFTSEKRFGTAKPESSYLRMPFADLVHGLEPDVVLGVNPGAEDGLLIPVQAIRDAGAITVAPGADYEIGDPSPEPTALLDDLSAWLRANRPEVRNAWRTLIAFPPAKPELLIGLELDPDGDPEVVFPAVQAGFDVGRSPVAFVPVVREAADDVARHMLDETTPFYVRD